MPDIPEHEDSHLPTSGSAENNLPGADTPENDTLESDPPAADTPEGDWPEGERPEGDRIAKLLARAGIASRRDVERMISEGRVRLHNELVTTPATILRTLRGVTVDGQPVRAAEAARLFAFHKPAGLLTAERDPAGRPTIYTALRNALPPETPRVMPVGRLDLNTEGLLLLTNDGELKRKLELPATGIPRTYRARTFGDISQNRLEELIEGIEIDGVRYAGIDANMERRTGRNQWIELTLTEGKNREVRRVLEHLGLEVSRLLRVAYGPFFLADLPRGAAVEIAPSQVEKFRVELGMPPSRAASERPPARLVQRSGRTPTAGGAVAKARPKPALARRKADPSRPDEALGRRTGAHDRSGPRERAEPRDPATPPREPAVSAARVAPDARGGRSNRGPRERPVERAASRDRAIPRDSSGLREGAGGLSGRANATGRPGPNDRNGTSRATPRDRAEPRERAERRDGAERTPRAAPRDWARTNDRKTGEKRATPRTRPEAASGAAERRAARERVAPGTLTSRPRDPDRPRNVDRPRNADQKSPRDPRPTGKGPPRSGPADSRPSGGGPSRGGPSRGGPSRDGPAGKGPPRKGPRS